MIFLNDVHAQLNAFIADEYCRAGDQFPYFVLALAAKRAIERIFRVAVAGLRHKVFIRSLAVLTSMLDKQTLG